MNGGVKSVGSSFDPADKVREGEHLVAECWWVSHNERHGMESR
ncbi:hypothetical protein BRCON_2610 [Candidatus Sumerlaea chitinivorans]|uniref:Uncharacterized protein n=1 Tax=Sumerlaea chitinivorans TaxID=2250252 RepID=A0A2Z4Y9L8_SUMC1|nr:hypothetical protein BRCON_2610 [Candidatus Sumerlaea chitinivorans]